MELCGRGGPHEQKVEVGRSPRFPPNINLTLVNGLSSRLLLPPNPPFAMCVAAPARWPRLHTAADSRP
eukprot:scaffold130615_cov66-Phaeocystis_antarctica.AAC.3